jgi:hypothetical protein
MDNDEIKKEIKEIEDFWDKKYADEIKANTAKQIFFVIKAIYDSSNWDGDEFDTLESWNNLWKEIRLLAEAYNFKM